MSDIRWQGHTHEEIYARVTAGPGAGVSAAAESAWKNVDQIIRDIDARLARAVADIGSGWEGTAASSATTALTPLGNWVTDAIGDTRLTLDALSGQAVAARDLRNAMPPPRHTNLPEHPPIDPTGYMPPSVTEDWAAADLARDNDAARAVELMNGYSNATYDNQRFMSYWSTPPEVTVETTSPPGSGVGWAGSGDAVVGAPTGAAPAAIGGAGGPAPGGGSSGALGLPTPATPGATSIGGPGAGSSPVPAVGGPGSPAGTSLAAAGAGHARRAGPDPSRHPAHVRRRLGERDRSRRGGRVPAVAARQSHSASGLRSERLRSRPISRCLVAWAAG